MLTRLTLAAGIALATALPLAAQDLTALSDEERTAFRAEVRAYLLENPEVLMEAIAVLEQRQAEAQAEGDVLLVSQNAAELFESPDDWVGGNPDGDITIVEFLDYRCGYCKRAHPEVKELLESDGNIRLIVKELPILGPQSDLASRFALAAKLVAGDAAYASVNDALMGLRGEISPASLDRLAADLGLDGAAILAQTTSDDVERVLQRNRALARAMDISGTPSFVMAGDMVRGYVPLEQMRLIVEEARSDG